ncbi:MAG: hypothetical protein Q8831_00075 ['Bonamia sp.' little leaf phytoplasma]|nr:hypothetical protein ['Bonamia sp.' little leaf phytoplasma]
MNIDKSQIVTVAKDCKFLSYMVKINPSKNIAKNFLRRQVNILLPQKNRERIYQELWLDKGKEENGT